MSLELEDQYDKIYRYCYFKVRNQATAEDLTQETFLRYFTQTSYVNKGKALAYLYVIARHLCTDHFRKLPVLPLNEEFIPLGEFPSSGEVSSSHTPIPSTSLPAADEFTRRETSLVVREAVASLPKEAQELLLLHYSNELGVGEIAAVLGISRFSVRRRLKAALKQLKELLREEDFL
ncbi:RNA polymerase sigma-70 factor (ECF subfamily) [Anaerotaenia torta]|uniref:RNA polymerase sigma factor n=1 Tax=Anaerotaenia torta TaxID=433293 RepID=UPI003D21AF03